MNACPECQRYYSEGFAFCPRDGEALREIGGLVEDEEDSLVGEWLDERYRIESCLHRGVVSGVYLATRQGSDRLVVVKVLRGALAGDEVAVGRFLRSARAAVRLQHPNIVRPLGHGKTAAGAPYVVMDLVVGRPLSQVLLDSETRSLAWLVEVARQIAQALDVAHKKGVAPWALSVDKVMIQRGRGDPGQVKLLDWGLSPKLQSRRKITRMDDEMFTQPYHAPREQVAALVPVDILALGKLLFVVIVGAEPTQRDQDEESLHSALLSWALATADGRRSRACERLADLVLRCLAVSPAARPRSMGEIDQVLRRIEQGLTLPQGQQVSHGSDPCQAAGSGPDSATPEMASEPGETTSEGIPVEPIDTIRQVRRYHPDYPARGGRPPISRQWLAIFTLLGGLLFVAGLVLGFVLRG